MLIVELESFPIDQIRDLDGFERLLGAWAAERSYDWRLLIYSRRFNMRPLVQATQHTLHTLRPLAEAAQGLLQIVQDLEAGKATREDVAHVVAALPDDHLSSLRDAVQDNPVLSDLLLHPSRATTPHWYMLATTLAEMLWRVPWLKDMIRFYEVLAEKHVRSATFYLLVWDVAPAQEEAVARSIANATGRQTTICESLPPTLTCTYIVEEQAARLSPQTPGHPYLSALRSYDMNGVWHATTLHALLKVPFDVTVAIDVTTFRNGTVMRQLELAKRTAERVILDGKDDPVAQRKYVQADEGMYRLNTESLHDVHIAVLVSGESPDVLSTNVSEIRDALGSTLRMDAVAGAQRALLQFWSTTRTKHIDAPLRAYNMWSHGIGCLLGVLGFHRARSTSGLCWGMDALRGAPLFYDLFHGNQAAHATVLGKTGFGKSFFINLVTLRAAGQLGYRIVGVDAFKNGARIEAAAGAGARCHWLGVKTPINILDAVYNERDGDWVPLQVQHAIGQLSLIFGRPQIVQIGDRSQEILLPETFSDEQEGVLDYALSTLYRQIDPMSGLNEMPILSDLIHELEQIGEPEARYLARRLRMKLFGSSTSTRLNETGRSLNVPSQVQWHFEDAINYYDFSEVPERQRGFYYANMVGAFHRFMRDPRRDVKHRTLCIIDEFHYVTRVEAVARLAAEICKVARKYGIGLIAVDQNPSTFLDNTYGRQIFENAVAKFLFHLDDLPAREMAAAISDLTPEHVRALTLAKPGQAISIFGNDIYHTIIEPSAQELRLLAGS